MADVKAVGEHLELKLRDVLFPLFIAIAGTNQSVSVLEAMTILGPDLTRGRIRHAVELLGGFSKKQLKKLESEFNQIGAFLD